MDIYESLSFDKLTILSEVEGQAQCLKFEVPCLVNR